MSDFSADVEKLRNWRENNVRKSREIIDIWNNTIENSLNKLGKEKFLVLEQVCIAALDCFRNDIANTCIKQLLNEFPNSLRVKKYEAMRLEANEHYDEALKILQSIIKTDDTNSAARKRKVAIYKAQGRNVDAIKELADYLKIFMADFEAWQELCELYITEQDFPKAAYCVEELILHNPHNHLLHQRYADLRYTLGGFENLELAKAYYCQALKLNPNNMRALYGLFLSATSIATSQKCSTQKKKESLKLAEWASNEIKKKYSNVKDDDSSVEERLAVLQIC